MGVTIHYRSTIDLARLPAMVAGLKEIAAHYGWGYTVMEDGEVTDHLGAADEEPEEEVEEEEEARAKEDEGIQIEGPIPLSGIILNPGEGCESIWLLYRANGRSSSIMTYVLARDGFLPEDKGWVWTKTQFTRLEVHVVLVELLRYLGQHYLSSLEVNDEGQYYETGDLAQLQHLREKLNFWLGRIVEGLSRVDRGERGKTMSPDALADRIERMVRELWQREPEK